MTTDYRLSTPSKIEEAVPTFARNVGLAGAVFFGVGLLLWFWNLVKFPYDPQQGPPASGIMIRLWLLIGTGGLAFHALRETDASIRRLYGLWAMGLISFGCLFLAFMLTAEGVRLKLIGTSLDGAVQESAFATARWVALGVTAVLGLLATLFALAPFIAACSAADGETALTPMNFPQRLARYFKGDVRIIGLGLLATQAAILAACFLLYGPLRELLRKELTSGAAAADANVLLFGLLPYGIGGVLLGLLFALIYQRTEVEEPWRMASLSVAGWFGSLAALAAFATVAADWLGLADVVVPYALVLGFAGFFLLWTFLQNLPSDSDLRYRAGWWLRLLALAVAGLALGRSIYPFIATDLLEQEGVAPYLVPSGFVLICLGLVFAWLGHSACSDGRLVAMINREVAAYFYSPIGYVVIGGMVILAWLSYLTWLEVLLERNMRTVPEPIVLMYFFGLNPVFTFIIVAPMLTMRLLSEEQRSGTMEVLLTAPVDETQVVISKFFGSWIMFMVGWSVWLIFPLIFRASTEEPFDYRPALSFVFGLSLMSSAFLSLGIFCSSLTKNQIIAFLLGLAGMFLLLAPGLTLFSSTESSPAWREFLQLISFLHHQLEFARGQVHWKYVIFYLSLTVFWLFLTIKVLEARKWK